MKPYFWGKTSPLLTHKPLTDNHIKVAEQTLGVTLPAAYLGILREQNGGYINYRGYPAPDVDSIWGDVLPVDFIWGIGHENGILDTQILRQLHDLPEKIVIFSGDQGFWLAMDYRSCKNYCDPPIVHIDLDANNRVTIIAPSFAAFMENLVLGEPEHILGIIALDVPQKLIMEQINRCWDIELTLADNTNSHSQTAIYYHSVWRGGWSDEQARILLFPNQFNNEEYHFPMFADCNWLLSCDLAEAAQMLTLETELMRCLPYEVIRINTPFIQQAAET